MSEDHIQAEAKRRLQQLEAKRKEEVELQRQQVELERELQESRIREERARLFAEEEMIRLKARQLALEEEARRLANEKEQAIEAEMERLKNRTPTEVLEDKVKDITAQLGKVKQDLLAAFDRQTAQTTTSLDSRVTELVQKNETHLVGVWSHIDKKLAEMANTFEGRIKEREDAIWTKLYYFRTFRWRILKNRGADFTQASVSFKGRINKSSLDNRKGHYHEFNLEYIYPNQKDQKFKITYTGELDTIEIYKEKMYTKHPTPTMYIRFTEPTLLTWFLFSKIQISENNGNWSNHLYDQKGVPDKWVFEGSNNEKDWVELYNFEKPFQLCSNNPCTVHACSYHGQQHSYPLNVYG